ncbi:hypothetical protein KDA_45050 [Dictyobacter alpinus]|uniref:HTH marR-type domain-containing protein n=1 Tax=Dictyobacter alpinus TaxID=2014873 RepID=A0A402BC76_9CHLR|nr:MarR family transcriptional regulator [Dictyobacter alpinus]GCE29021.1 hypothetical protein KDA_45050 [Dictyobacter alpinus]
MEPIQGYIGYELIQAFRAHHLRAEKELGLLGLRPSQELILLQLWEQEGLSQSLLAERMKVEQSTMSVMLRRMEKAGFIERRQDLQDARISRIYLTQKGRELESRIRAIWEELEHQTLAGLTMAEQVLLRRLLQQVRTNLL